jgi:hypothetical protein
VLSKWIANRKMMPPVILDAYTSLGNLRWMLAALRMVNVKTGFDVAKYTFFAIEADIRIPVGDGIKKPVAGWFFGAIHQDVLPAKDESGSYQTAAILNAASHWVCIENLELPDRFPIVVFDKRTTKLKVSSIPMRPAVSETEPSLSDMLAYRIFRDDFFTVEEAEAATQSILAKFTKMKK